jgi:hypothetical protein
VNRDDGVLRVVLPTEKLLDFRSFDLLLQLVQVALQIVGNGFPFLGPADERPNLFLSVIEVLNEIQIALDAASFSGKALTLSRVRPNGGVG